MAASSSANELMSYQDMRDQVDIGEEYFPPPDMSRRRWDTVNFMIPEERHIVPLFVRDFYEDPESAESPDVDADYLSERDVQLAMQAIVDRRQRLWREIERLFRRDVMSLLAEAPSFMLRLRHDTDGSTEEVERLLHVANDEYIMDKKRLAQELYEYYKNASSASERRAPDDVEKYLREFEKLRIDMKAHVIMKDNVEVEPFVQILLDIVNNLNDAKEPFDCPVERDVFRAFTDPSMTTFRIGGHDAYYRHFRSRKHAFPVARKFAIAVDAIRRSPHIRKVILEANTNYVRGAHYAESLFARTREMKHFPYYLATTVFAPIANAIYLGAGNVSTLVIQTMYMVGGRLVYMDDLPFPITLLLSTARFKMASFRNESRNNLAVQYTVSWSSRYLGGVIPEERLRETSHHDYSYVFGTHANVVGRYMTRVTAKAHRLLAVVQHQDNLSNKDNDEIELAHTIYDVEDENDMTTMSSEWLEELIDSVDALSIEPYATTLDAFRCLILGYVAALDHDLVEKMSSMHELNRLYRDDESRPRLVESAQTMRQMSMLMHDDTRSYVLNKIHYSISQSKLFEDDEKAQRAVIGTYPSDFFIAFVFPLLGNLYANRSLTAVDFGNFLEFGAHSLFVSDFVGNYAFLSEGVRQSIRFRVLNLNDGENVTEVLARSQSPVSEDMPVSETDTYLHIAFLMQYVLASPKISSIHILADSMLENSFVPFFSPAAIMAKQLLAQTWRHIEAFEFNLGVSERQHIFPVVKSYMEMFGNHRRIKEFTLVFHVPEFDWHAYKKSLFEIFTHRSIESATVLFIMPREVRDDETGTVVEHERPDVTEDAVRGLRGWLIGERRRWRGTVRHALVQVVQEKPSSTGTGSMDDYEIIRDAQVDFDADTEFAPPVENIRQMFPITGRRRGPLRPVHRSLPQRTRRM